MVGELRVMGQAGDTKIIWDAGQEDEVATARRTFNELRAKRYNAYAVKKNGDQGELINEFDPEAEKIILAPPMAGG